MKIILICLPLILIGCANSKGDKNTGVLELSEADLASVSTSVCTNGQKLTLVPSEGSDLASLKPAIAFISGSGACALRESIRDEWFDILGNRWFFYLSIGRCVPNQSIWIYKSGHALDGNRYYTYRNITDDSEISLSGNADIGATYARDHAGIRVLRCQ